MHLIVMALSVLAALVPAEPDGVVWTTATPSEGLDRPAAT